MNTQHPLSTDKRLVWADALRGLLILLVVLGHSLQHGDFENRLSWNIINSFHVPTFFIISGYLNYKSANNPRIITKRMRELLLPFCSWILLGCLFSSNIYKHLYFSLIFPDNSYWFIYVLFIITTLFICLTLLSKALNTNSEFLIGGGVLILTGLMVVFNWRILGFQFIAYYFTFYAIGYYFRKYDVRFTISATILLGILWFIGALFWRKHETPLPLQGITFLPENILTYGYRFIIALLGGFFMMGVAPRIMNSTTYWLNRGLCYFGRISLGIYIIHLFVGRFFKEWFFELFPSLTCWQFVCSDFCLKLLLSIMIIYILQHTPGLSLLLLGQKHK